MHLKWSTEQFMAQISLPLSEIVAAACYRPILFRAQPTKEACIEAGGCCRLWSLDLSRQCS
jgi:hypothetical protein